MAMHFANHHSDAAYMEFCCLQAYVRPTEHPQLDPFCIQLTGIQQHQVDAAEPLQMVLQRHHEWLQEQGMFKQGIQFVPVTWTAWDFQVCESFKDIPAGAHTIQA